MSIYQFFKPLLFCLDPELAHDSVRVLGRIVQQTRFSLPLLKRLFCYESSYLRVNVLGLSFENPVGLAAGFDKNCELIEFMQALGFGFVEIGSISALPSPGNNRPRLFRLVDDHGLVNRMGLNNQGAESLAGQLAEVEHRCPIGVSLVKTHNPDIVGADAVNDLIRSYSVLAKLGDFYVLNLSCPNTREGKTFEEPESLSTLLNSICKRRKELNCNKPLLAKLSPDLSREQLKELVTVCEEKGVDGYVLTNTSATPCEFVSKSEVVEKAGRGGVSGRPILKKALTTVRHVYQLTEGQRIIIGCGGIDSAEVAYQYIKAGASLLELYTGLVYQGPSLVRRINQGLEHLLKQDKFSNISQAVGTEV